MAPVRIVGLGGSLAPSSRSLTALKLALDAAHAAGAVTELIDLKELDLPNFRPGVEVYPASVLRLIQAVDGAHGLIWSSPTYHGGVSGAFKNAIDWFDALKTRGRPKLDDKVIGLIAVSGGPHALHTVTSMDFMVRSLRAVAVPTVVAIPHSRTAFDEHGRPSRDGLEKQLHRLGAETTRLATQLSRGEHAEPRVVAG
ncbi:MAG: NADPH-dependent FMN reductase [Actinomycetota bacterium]